MGNLAIKPSMTVFVWILALCIIGINLYIVGGFVIDQASDYPKGAGWIYSLSAVAALFYLAFIATLVSQDLAWCRQRAGDAFKKLGSHDVVEGYDILEDLSTSTTHSPEEGMNGGSGREGGALEPLKSEGLEDAEGLGGNGRAAAEGSGDGGEVRMKGAHRDVKSDSDYRV